MNATHVLVGVVLSVTLSTSPAALADDGAARLPNIVVILADDLGVGDVQALYPKGKIATPHLDRFVEQGVSFTDAHSGSAVCTPTRYGLLTGRYCWRSPLQYHVLHRYEAPLIAADRLTLPAMLKRHGYRTACIGKWHLGFDWPKQGDGWDYTCPLTNGPTTRGFDYYFGTHVPNFEPYTFIENDRIVQQPTDWFAGSRAMHMRSGKMAPGWRFDRILPELTDRAVKYIHEQAKHREPFFLYFAMTSPHEPVAPSERFQGKSGIAPIADFVMETDWSAGQVIKALDDAGVADDTLVVFTADNGHSYYTGMKVLQRHGHEPSGPYRGYKGQIWEGGHRVPTIARWPGHIKPGSQSDQLMCLNDLMATCAAIVGEKLPDEVAEDSVNILPALEGRDEGPLREALVHHDRDGRFAIRQGPWKLVILARKKGAPKLELYNLKQDIAETKNVIEQHPQVVERLMALLEKYVADGRSTPGTPQTNDAEVDVRHLSPRRLIRPSASAQPAEASPRSR